MFDKLSRNQIIVLCLAGLVAFWLIYQPREGMASIGVPKHAPENPLDSEMVRKTRRDSEYALYYFYHPRCGWCNKFKPTWEEVRRQLSGGKIALVEVDVSDNANDDLSFYYNVDAYPTLIYVTPKRNYEYNGNRTVRDIMAFITRNA